MKTLTIKRTTSLTGFPASAIRLALATLCVILMTSAARAQDARPAEPAPDAQQQSGEQPTPDKGAPPAEGLLQVGEQTSQANQVVDGDFVFTSPGQFPYPRDIRLSDNFGGLRFYGASSLTASPQGAAIQFFGNNAAPFGGQLFLDSGALNSAALIFRTAPTSGTITERMRIGSNGNVSIGTTNTSTPARLTVIAAASSGAINAFSPDGTSITGSSNTNRGVAGFSTSGIGVLGNSLSGIGVRGSTNSTAGLAGQFDGNVQILGNLTKSSGSFKIDHPLDPENKYLSHSFVESPDMMNIYNGNVVLDAKGRATVTMPAWFDALNKDFRYQLTAVGAPGPDVHVAEVMKGNRFKIAGGRAGMKVSWQVTGVRRDAYANLRRVPVEEDKPAAERGTYLNPEAFGQPKEKGIAQTQLPEEARRSTEGREESEPK